MASGNPTTNHLEWFAKAGEDELSTGIILNHGGACSTACFLSQQMAEKYVKGMAVFRNLSFPKVHDLLELETLLLKDIPEIQERHEDLQYLNRYYIETRYPGDYPEIKVSEAREAFAAASRIKDFVLQAVAAQK